MSAKFIYHILSKYSNIVIFCVPYFRSSYLVFCTKTHINHNFIYNIISHISDPNNT